MNIYLDISGVLLHGGKAANFADDFLQFVVKYWPENTYWLTSYCWQGNNRAAAVMEPFVNKQTADVLGKIKPTDWNELKTDGINFRKPFLWFDDNLALEERKILQHYNALECHRRIQLSNDPNQLMDEIEYLKTLI